MASIKVSPVPLFEDNYAWKVVNETTREVLLVDPADAPACLAALEAAGADGPELVGALVTHHHWDHAGGNMALAAARRGLEIVGGVEEVAMEGRTKAVADGEVFEAGGIRWTALHTPCHTRGHVCFFTDADADAGPVVFTGDTLFAGGCGRFFEGTAEQMRTSLLKLASLPPATRVYCGHEYTVSNLLFCAHVEPGNAATAARLALAREQRSHGEPTVPSTLADELATNVFLRCDEASVRAFTHPEVAPEARAALPAVEVLARLREAKNGFKPPPS